ncbi:hypothetical protein C8R45DRAFT_1037049, partial [Mycena sanguinolenta]
LLYQHIALRSCSLGELSLFDLIPGLTPSRPSRHVLIQTLRPPSLPARPPVDPTSALSVFMLFSLPLLRASFLAVNPLDIWMKFGRRHVCNIKPPSIEADQTSVDNTPCRYRAPFGAHRGGSDSLALTPRAFFFFYLPTYLISLFFLSLHVSSRSAALPHANANAINVGDLADGTQPLQYVGAYILTVLRLVAFVYLPASSIPCLGTCTFHFY